MQHHENVKGIGILIDKGRDYEGLTTCTIAFDKRVLQNEADSIIRSFQTYTAHSRFRDRYEMHFRINRDRLPGNLASHFFEPSNDIGYLGGDPRVFLRGSGKSIDYRFEFCTPFGIEERTAQFCTFLRKVFFRHVCMGDESTDIPWNSATKESTLRVSVAYDEIMRIARQTLDDKKYIKFKMLFINGIYWCKTRMGADLSLCNLLAIIFQGDPSSIDYEFQESALYSDLWNDDKYRERTIAKAVKYFFNYHNS